MYQYLYTDGNFVHDKVYFDGIKPSECRGWSERSSRHTVGEKPKSIDANELCTFCAHPAPPPLSIALLLSFPRLRTIKSCVHIHICNT